MKKILILGGSGMLGSMVCDYLESTEKYSITATVRTDELLNKCKAILPKVQWDIFNIDNETQVTSDLESLGRFDYIINCIGITKPYCKDDNPEEVETAIKVNALFPHILGKYADKHNSTVLQIATDCVYSGKSSLYDEKSEFDPTDVYGKTKSLGESYYKSVKNLRCSIIGPEYKTQAFLLEWVLKQQEGSSINGFANHNWNGVSTLQFAKICHGIMQNNIELEHIQHIIPADILNKYELVSVFAKYFNKNIIINKTDAAIAINRTLSTVNKDMNYKIWQAAGYQNIPTLEEMTQELGKYNYRFK